MNKQLTGAVVLLSITLIWGIAAWLLGEMRGVFLFGMTVIGQVSMLAVILLAQREERKAVARPHGKLASRGTMLAALLLPGLAKAIIPIAIGIGVAVGLLGWGAIKIWSKALSIQERNARKPVVVADANPAGDTNEVLVAVVTTPPPSTPSGETAIFAAAAAVQPSGEDTAPAVSVFVPAGYTLEYSTNLTHWGTIRPATTFDEETWWIAEGPSGFFRYRVDDTNAIHNPALD